MTEGPAQPPRPRPGEGDEPLRSVTLDRLGRQQASTARLAASWRSRGLWLTIAGWLVLVLALVIWRGATIGGTVAALVGGVAVALWVVSRTSMRAVTAVYPKDQKVTITTTSEGLSLQTVRGTWQAPWADFRTAERSHGHLLLHRKGPGGAVVLVPGLVGPEVYDDLMAAGVPITGPGDAT